MQIEDQDGDRKVYPYAITLRPMTQAEAGTPDGVDPGWVAEVPQLDGVMTDAPTPWQAALRVQDAIACWLGEPQTGAGDPDAIARNRV